MMISAITPYNSYNKFTNSFGLRRGRTMPNFYKKSKKDFDSFKISQELNKKYSSYPMALKGVILLIPEYFSGKSDINTFTKNFLDRTPTLLTRMDLSDDGKAFKNAYGREVSLIKSLDHFCYEYAEGKVKKEDFDHLAEIHANELLKA